MAALKTVGVVVLSLSSLASSKEMPVNMKLRAEVYANGLAHERIMTTKHVSAFVGRCRGFRFLIINEGVESMGRDGQPRCFRLNPVRRLRAQMGCHSL